MVPVFQSNQSNQLSQYYFKNYSFNYWESKRKINIIILNIISNKSGLTFVPGDLHFDFRYTQVKDKK